MRGRRHWLFGALAAVVLLIATTVSSARTNSITFADPATASIDQSSDHQANDFKPDACAYLDLHQIADGSTATITGPDGGALIIAGPTTTSITGGSGDDCIVGGSATTVIHGGPGNDTCFGAVGTTVDCEDPHTL